MRCAKISSDTMSDKAVIKSELRKSQNCFVLRENLVQHSDTMSGKDAIQSEKRLYICVTARRYVIAAVICIVKKLKLV